MFRSGVAGVDSKYDAQIAEAGRHKRCYCR